MPNRREFIQSSAVASALAANGVIARSATAGSGPAPITLAGAVYDDRYAEGRRFAAVAGAQGVATRALDAGDITRFFQDDLATLWQRGPVALAGFTQFGPMFVVERLAAEHGMHLALRVEHRAAADGGVTHRFAGPRETLALAVGFEALQADWPGLTAALACRVGVDDSPHRSVELATPAPAPTLLQDSAPAASFIHYYTPLAEQQGYGAPLDGPLYSWVVAPRAQRG